MSSDGKFPRPVFAAVWRRLQDFSGLGGDATYLWPRWLFLRGVGLVFIVIFAGIIDESRALVGPHGLAPLSGLMAQLRAAHPGALEAFLRAPSLFWSGTGMGWVLAVEWGGMAAAVALVLNLWPRLSLFTCWLGLLSFANSWVVFSDPGVDWLMLEVALLCLPFAPAGFRPGLGAHSPPRPIALFMMRWLLFRVMLENGLSKIISADPRWLNLTAMDDFYETAPCPTILGYLDHQLPHAWHVGEIGLTFLAEYVAPLLAMFGGRRGRWFAFGCWTVFEVGIQLTCNFGWLNTASLALGLVLLDDQMLAAAAGALRLRRLAGFLVSSAATQTVPVIVPWKKYGLRVALWTHFYLSIVVFTDACKVPENKVVAAVTRPLKFLFQGFGSVNPWTLFAWLETTHQIVEFSGSNDGGRTWRAYDFRYYPQREDRIPPFLAPCFPRLEETLQIQAATRDQPAAIYGLVATRLLEQNQGVTGLFERNPFPDHPPQMIRMAAYELTFTHLATHRSSGKFWHRRYLAEYLPMKYVDAAGRIAEAVSAFDQVRVKADYGNPEAQSYLGLMYVNGEEGVAKDGAEAAKWFRLAAGQGVAAAQLNLALIYANGDGVPKDPAEAARWCRQAAEQGLAAAQDRLGIMYYEGDGVPRDETEALAWFKVAALSGDADAAQHEAIAESRASPTTARLAALRSQAILTEIEAHRKNHGD